MSDAARARLLARRRRRARFALGERLRHLQHGDVGSVEAVYADLAAAIEAGVVDRRWLAAQRPRPATPASGHWYAVVLADGSALWGERDVRRAR